VTALRSHGFDASAVAQEHSGIPWLWRHSDPDLLIYLDVPLATVRDRRGQEWPQAVYDAQEERLVEARAHADLVIDTAAVSIRGMTERALAFVREREQSPEIAGDGGL
jgi:hypothetical protein